MTSEAKARQFATVAEQNGWKVKVEEVDAAEDHWNVDAERGDELINIFWVNNTLTETPKYTLAGNTTSLHNKATATRQLALKPDLKKAYRKPRRVRGAAIGAQLLDGDGGGEESSGGILPAVRHELPFEIWESTDKEILRAIRGSRVVYWNALLQRPEAVAVSKQQNMNLSLFNISQYPDRPHRPTGDILDPAKGRPILNFVTLEGFRSVALESILQIG
jgi:hypothetical protein